MNKAFQLRLGLTALALVGILFALNWTVKPSLTAQASNNSKALGLEQLSLLAELRLRKVSALISKEGWLWQIAYYTNATSGGTLPNGKTIPIKYSIETWWFVTTSGDVKVGVDIMRDSGGEIIQTGVTQNGRTVNKDAGLNIAVPTWNLIKNLATDDLATFQKSYGGDFTIQLVGDGKTMITLALNDSRGGKVEGYEKLVVSSKRTSTYDANGALINQQMIIGFEDGSEAILNSVDVSPLEAINQPPAEVLKLLGE